MAAKSQRLTNYLRNRTATIVKRWAVILFFLGMCLIPVGVALSLSLERDVNLVSAASWTVERAVEWDRLFDRNQGWTGADGIYSIPLSGNDAPGSASRTHTLFVFSDTFIGTVAPNGKRLTGSTLVNNTVALLKGGEADDEAIRFFWRQDGDDNPTAVFVPNTPETKPGDWYWLMDGLSLDGQIQLFALRMKEGDGGVFNFAVAGVSRISFPGSSVRQAPLPTQVDTPLFLPATQERGEVYLGQAIMSNTAQAGAPAPDGYIYIYGPQNDPLIKKLVAARVTPDAFTDFSQWRYWDGMNWSTGFEDIAPITDRISSEFSVTPLPDGRFLLVFQQDTLGPNTVVRIGNSPVGPFGPMTTLWTCPEPDFDPDIYCYNAKAHPHLSQPGELLISYNVNTFDFWDHFAHADIYRPRFIRVRLGAQSGD